MSRSRIFGGLPTHGAGQRIGLLGGSFNPAHAAHRMISLMALRRLRLDRVWWLVTPGNPLKENSGLPDLDRRMRQAAEIADHPLIDVTGIEARFGTRFTADLVVNLKTRLPTLRLVWLMGSDNLGSFHRWDRWRDIAASVPIAVVNRPGHLAVAGNAVAARALAARRLPEPAAPCLAETPAPAWIFLHGPRSPLSSTSLRDTKS